MEKKKWALAFRTVPAALRGAKRMSESDKLTIKNSIQHNSFRLIHNLLKLYILLALSFLLFVCVWSKLVKERHWEQLSVN